MELGNIFGIIVNHPIKLRKYNEQELIQVPGSSCS